MKLRYIQLFFVAFFALTLCCCDTNSPSKGGGSSSGTTNSIPSDDLADPNPEVPEDSINTSIPNIQLVCEKDGNDVIVTIDMTGIQAVDSEEWLRLIGTAKEGTNIWISIDDEPKGIDVQNTADNNTGSKSVVDLVFVVDNSGSMYEEADTIAKNIADWAKKLAASNLDIKFGCVGYNGSIEGAINITDVNALEAYLNREGYTGTYRTVDFAGDDAEALSNASYDYRETYGECAGTALRYADDLFSFRSGANRIYVNFTDEPNQPSGYEKYSVEFFKDQANWNTTKGTVHTVYSEDTTYSYWSDLYDERPWLISEYTGGTKLFAPSDFEGVSLDKLPVTGAMQNSYVIRFTNVAHLVNDGQQHLLKITIRSGETKADREFYVTFVLAE